MSELGWIVNHWREIVSVVGAAYFVAFIPILIFELDLDPSERWWGR